jgi:replication initiation protein RepC
VQILQTARDYELSGGEWTALERDAAVIAKTLKGVERLEEMEERVVSLERRQYAARTSLEMVLKNVEKTRSGVKTGPQQYTYNRSPYLSEDTVIATKSSSELAASSGSQYLGPEARSKPDRGTVHGIRPDELVQLAPRLRSYLRRPNPTWPDVIDAADWLRHDLEVSKSLWGDACVTIGRDLAAVALAIVSTKQPEHFRTTPGGYFRGMIQKAKAGELHLERTVWALRRANQPTRTAPQSGQGRGVGLDYS